MWMVISTINVQKNQVLIFSFIGYKDVEIVVKPNLNLSKVVMSESTATD